MDHLVLFLKLDYLFVLYIFSLYIRILYIDHQLHGGFAYFCFGFAYLNLVFVLAIKIRMCIFHLYDIFGFYLFVCPRGRLTPLICERGARSPLPAPRPLWWKTIQLNYVENEINFDFCEIGIQSKSKRQKPLHLLRTLTIVGC